MNRWMTLVAFVAWSGLAFGAGWAWRGDRAERDTSTAAAATGKQALQVEQAARATEHQQASTLAAIGAKHEEDRESATSVPAAVVADLRDGVLQLRDDLATCNTSLLSQAVTGAVERDAHAQLREEVAGALVQIGRDADDHVRACQAVIQADRAALEQ